MKYNQLTCSKISIILISIVFISAGLMCFTGCSGRSLKEIKNLPPLPQATETMPAHYTFNKNDKQNSISAETKSPWWETFGCRELNELIEKALEGNFTIKEASARLRQAKASENSGKAALFPSITYSASASRQERDESADSNNYFSIGPAASYEIDLWGNINAAIQEAEHKTMATGFDLESAAMSVAAEVAGNWFSLISVREELALIRSQVEINKMILDLLELRFRNAMSTVLDILQQREVLARTLAKIPSVELRERNLINSIALLTGKAPVEITSVETIDLKNMPGDFPPLPDDGLPSELLFQRPDIRAAYMRFVSSRWNQLQVMNERLPSLNLTGSLLVQHTTLDNILKQWVLSLAAHVAGDIFDGGAHKASLEIAEAVVDQSLINYRETVYTAIMEVENAVASEKSRIKWIELMEAELEAAKLAMEEAKNRYINGLDPFLPFVTEQINVQNLELSLLKQQVLLFQDRVTLHRALGGNWTKTRYSFEMEQIK
ncbi:Outer membrane efflux protein [Desulfamplus magnetovallimortis]|uniref:Outer membrane efflux protein n=1 Tax=Desulfamplus magnetovallimortis TaxID=1246637 RepID=A0A1W1H8Y1_9BACT|nr:efflux transporter outer membrane subunit [Desulfamplus magnetovallimortis]SLM28896.1 Outer membrane efflux protein [Desulfamplus magnetovallimortis]